jgi:hypothetical protein
VIYLKIKGKLLKARDVHPKKQIALGIQQNDRDVFGKKEGFYDMKNIDPLLNPGDFKVWMFYIFFYYFIIFY